jgi:glycopeptide antibiotics resistance protein
VPETKRPPTILHPPRIRRPRLATILSARAAYVAIILIATLANLEPNWHDGLASERLARALSPRLVWSDTIDGLRNILLFAGFGAVWEVTTTGRLRDALWRATLYGCLLSITVETLQLFSPVRNASIADVATNTVGTFIGAFGLALLVAMTRTRRDARSYIAIPAFLPALGQLIAVLAEGIAPLLRQEYLPVYGGPLTRLRATFAAAAPFTAGSIPLTDLVFSIPAGFLGVTALTELGLSRAVAAGLMAVAGMALSFAAEIAHGATGEVIIWGAAVAHAVGIVAGAVLALAFLPAITQRFRGVRRARLFLAAYVVFLMVWVWRPFVLRWPLSSGFAALTVESFTPMNGLAQRSDVFSVAKVIQLFALMMPVGALLGAWPARKRGPLRWVLPAVWLSAVLALGHIVIAERTFDITNFLIMVAGAWLGWWVVRRAGVPERGILLDPMRD